MVTVAKAMVSQTNICCSELPPEHMKLPYSLGLFSILLAGLGQALAVNVATNPGFESGTINWTTWGSTIAASTEQKRTGTNSCLNTARTSDWQGAVQDLNGKLTLGSTYRITAFLRLRNTAGIRGQLTIQRTDTAGVSYYGSDTPLLSDTDWTPVILYYTHGGTSVTGINLYCTTPGSLVEFFVDDVTVETIYDAQAVSVDLSATGAATSQSATGFLFGVSGNEPQTAYFEPLKPGLVRFDAALGNPNFRGAETGFASSLFMNRMKATACKMQVIISDEYQWVNNFHVSWGWPGDPASGGYTSYQLLDQVINNLMDAAATSYPASGGWQIEWDIWNEPDYSVFWGRDQAQFFQTWKRAVQTIRNRDANAVIVGPSVAQFNPIDGGQYIKDFLIFARDNNVLPNVLSWHALENPKNVQSSIAAVRKFMTANSIAALPIDINEYSGDQEYTKVGTHVRYMAGLERGTVRRAAHAIWDEVPGSYASNGVQPGHLCHLLTQDASHSPRALWHVYRNYADFAGNIIPVKPNILIDGMAAKDSSGTVRMIFGNDSDESNTANLTINRLDALPYFTSTGNVRVIVTRIPNTGTAALAVPNVVSNTTYAPGSTSLTIPLSFGPQEALSVQVLDSGAQAVVPSSFTVAQGTFSSGTVANVASDNNLFLAVNSQTSGSTRFATTDFTLTGITSAGLSKLEVLTITKSSAASTSQQVSIWNYLTSAWVQLDSTTIGLAEVARNMTVTTNVSSYLSSGSVKIRITSSKVSSSFTLSTEQVRVVASLPATIVVDNFSFENPLGGTGTQNSNWATTNWGIYPYTAPTLVPTKGSQIAYTNTAGGMMYQIIDSATLATGDKLKVRLDIGWPAPNAWAGVTVGFSSVNGPSGAVVMPSFSAVQPPVNGWNTLTMDMTVSAQQAGGNLQMAIYGTNGIQAVVDNVRVEVSR